MTAGRRPAGSGEITRQVRNALSAVESAPSILSAVRASTAVSVAARRDGGAAVVAVLRGAVDGCGDDLVAIAAVHALGAVADNSAAGVLTGLLSGSAPFLAEHAAWSLGSRDAWPAAVGGLVAGVVAGGLGSVLCQQTLRRWGPSMPGRITTALDDGLRSCEVVERRIRLVETVGLIPGPAAATILRTIAGDKDEPVGSRQAAVAAIGDRGDDPAAVVVRGLMRTDGELADVARLAAFDLAAGSSTTRAMRRAERGQGGQTVAQLFLHADLDRELSLAGVGDNGGIATMLVGLGDELATAPGIDRVLTLSRGTGRSAVAALGSPPTGHALLPVPLLRAPTGAPGAWPAYLAAERGIRRTLIAHGPVDALHLRMADVGSMAAAKVAAGLGIPTVFTLAPDPHVGVNALDLAGALGRSDFGRADFREKYWFRMRLVDRLARGARHCVLFPRPHLREQLRELLDIDITQRPARYTVVAEGIDLSVSAAALADVHRPAPSDAQAAHSGLAELASLVAALPADRHGLPLVLSVGRLHPVKGMATVVQAWLSDPALRKRCNLLIVGGDLRHPSLDERGQLDSIAAAVAADPGAAGGLIVAGHRPHGVTARWMAAAAHGWGTLIAPAGAYVCGSLKEEFGLALVEALAAGLVVVGPQGGGPATYIDDGVTGFLVDTRVPALIGGAVGAALDLAAAPDATARATAARLMVARRFTLASMAESLAGIYGDLSATTQSRMTPTAAAT